MYWAKGERNFVLKVKDGNAKMALSFPGKHFSQENFWKLQNSACYFCSGNFSDDDDPSMILDGSVYCSLFWRIRGNLEAVFCVNLFVYAPIGPSGTKNRREELWILWLARNSRHSLKNKNRASAKKTTQKSCSSKTRILEKNSMKESFLNNWISKKILGLKIFIFHGIFHTKPKVKVKIRKF